MCTGLYGQMPEVHNPNQGINPIENIPILVDERYMPAREIYRTDIYTL